MRLARLVLVGLVFLTGACDRAPTAQGLADGCYYAQGKPVFKIVGTEGQVLIPGEVRSFKVERSGANVTFVPGLLFDNSAGGTRFVHAYSGAPPYSMKTGTSAPTIRMHWAAYGDEDIILGKPC